MLFLAAGLIMTGHAILTPLLMVILMICGDILGMSLTTDNVRPSTVPNAWRIREVTLAGIFVGLAELVYCAGVLWVAKAHFGLGLDALRTVTFVSIVFGNQATTYTNRGRQQFGAARPSPWLLGSSAADISIAVILSVCGVAMTPLPLSAVGAILLAAAAFAFILNFAKVPVFRRLKIA
jgi:H+-transporting ATPase